MKRKRETIASQAADYILTFVGKSGVCEEWGVIVAMVKASCPNCYSDYRIEKSREKLLREKRIGKIGDRYFPATWLPEKSK